MRRKVLSLEINNTSCDYKDPRINYNKFKDYIILSLIGKGGLINNSNLLIKVYDKNHSTNTTLINGNFNNDLVKNDCYNFKYIVPINNKIISDLYYQLDVRLQKLSKEIINIDSKINNLTFEDNIINLDNQILMDNKISNVFDLGQMLRKGQFEKLFNLVGILNQSDPKQNYLKHSEIRYEQQYQENKNLDDLYAILISQILQKKVTHADQIIDEILEYDKKNGNTFLSKGIINLYLLRPNEAKKYIDLAKVKSKSTESKKIIKIADGLADLLNLNFIDAFNKLV